MDKRTADQKRLYVTMQAEMELLEGRGIMTENELLLAISDMMDHKLKSELQPIKNDLQTVKNEVQLVKNEVQLVKEDLQTVKNEVQLVKDEVQLMKEDLETVKDKVQTIENDVHHMKLYQENIIMPRLNTIESCYTDTYGRYRNYSDKMEAAFEDIELLKRVVSEHSMKLQALG